jgi:hypothetical protein
VGGEHLLVGDVELLAAVAQYHLVLLDHDTRWRPQRITENARRQR